jgi:hypothetical protein
MNFAYICLEADVLERTSNYASQDASSRNLRIITGDCKQQKQAAAVTRPGTDTEVI